MPRVEDEGWRAPGPRHLTDILALFERFGVGTVCVDEADFAGVVQRLHAAGAVPFEHIEPLLALGALELGGYGQLRRFEWVE